MTAMTQHHQSAQSVRQKLSHPVVDTDGHVIELLPAIEDYVKEIAGGDASKRVQETYQRSWHRWFELSEQQRQEHRAIRKPWWGLPTNAYDLGSVLLPKLYRERMDELGIDFALMYPSNGLFIPQLVDAELRPVVCRAINTYHRDVFQGFTDRLAPVAVIPMHTPEEAIAELEYSVRKLNFKACMFPTLLARTVPALRRFAADLPPELAMRMTWIDTFALDSEYNYDPVWEKCIELKVAFTAHSGSQWVTRQSISNFCYNHIGMFGASAEALCKAIVIGGVAHRFPKLNFAFLEGGVNWALGLLSGLVGHWDKRNGNRIEMHNPKNTDLAQLTELIRKYALPRVAQVAATGFHEKCAHHSAMIGDWWTDNQHLLDEWKQSGVKSHDDLRAFFSRFYFGCEGDDPTVSGAFRQKDNPLQVRFNAIFGSDVGHWDVPDPTHCLTEAYEFVEQGHITEEDFRDLTFTNPVRLHGGMNPDFFKGTVVESSANKILANDV
jgi:predicted TIM-barrel fold metal-dependent hydrolase